MQLTWAELRQELQAVLDVSAHCLLVHTSTSAANTLHQQLTPPSLLVQKKVYGNTFPLELVGLEDLPDDTLVPGISRGCCELWRILWLLPSKMSWQLQVLSAHKLRLLHSCYLAPDT